MLFSICLLVAESPVAITLKAKGDVTLERAKKISELKSGTPLQNNDYLESKDNSYAAFRFVDGNSLMKLFPNSTLQVKTEKVNGELNKKTYLKSGSVFSKISKKKGDFSIETPSTVASVKGTKWFYKTTQGGDYIITFTGIVEFKNKGDNKSVFVKAGEIGYSRGSGEIEVRPFNPADLDETDEDLKEIKDYMEDDELLGTDSRNDVLEIVFTDEDGNTKKLKVNLQ